MARSNYSAGKRQREADKAAKRKKKSERKRDNRQSGGGDIPIATVDEIQGGMRSIDDVMRSVNAAPGEVDRGHGGIPSRLFVGGLSWRTTTEDLRAAFEAVGPVNDAVVVLDRDTGDSRGFGFVTMADHKDAAIAIRKLGGAELDGRTLVVRQATDRQR